MVPKNFLMIFRILKKIGNLQISKSAGKEEFNCAVNRYEVAVMWAIKSVNYYFGKYIINPGLNKYAVMLDSQH